MEQKIMENTIKQVATPEDAIAQFVGDQYMGWLMEYAEHEVASWESLKQIAQSNSKPEKIKKLILQRYLADQAYAGKEGDPGLVGFAIANLSESPDPVAEHALELLQKIPDQEISKNQWHKLFSTLGISDEEIKRSEPKEITRNYIANLSDIYSNSEWQATMGAYIGYLKLTPIEYSSLAAVLKATMQISDSDLGVLLNSSKDTKLIAEINLVLERVSVDEEGKGLIFQGLKSQLESHKEFWDGSIKYFQD